MALVFCLRWVCLVVVGIAAVAEGAQVHPRNCGGGIRHVHMAVGSTQDASTSVTISFASILSNRKPPVAGVLLGTSASAWDRLILADPSQGPAEESVTSYNVSTAKNLRSQNLYISPFYHHVTVTNLQPSQTYYYQLLVHNRRQDFQQYSTLLQHRLASRRVLSAATEMNPWIDTNENQVQPESIEDDEEFRLRLFSHWHEDVHRRRLINWPPYDASQKPCPLPNKTRSFRTAPPKGAVDAPVRLAIVGDLGQFPHSEETLAQLIKIRNEVDTIILAGDLAYTNEDHRLWDTFFDMLDDYPLVDGVTTHICTGNHDIDKLASSQQIFLAFENRFRMPRVQPSQLGLYDGPTGVLNMDAPPYPLAYEWGNAYYYYTHGPVFFVVVSAYSSMEPNSTQYKWIQQTLQQVNRSSTPWLVTVLHTPLYNTFAVHQHDLQIVAAKQNLEPLLVQYRVNLVFTGHVHAYLRTLPVVRDQVNATGPIHITVGAGGRECEAPFMSAQPEPWVAVRDATWYGFGYLQVVNRTMAYWEFIPTNYTDSGRKYNELWHSNRTLPPGNVHDHVWIRNQYYL